MKRTTPDQLSLFFQGVTPPNHEGDDKERKKPKTHLLSVFLIRDGLTSTDFLSGSNRDPIAVKDIGNLYVRQTPDGPPRWLSFFEDALAEDPKLHGASNGAVLVVKRSQRIFALTFGQGRHMLESGTWEENFGLRVTLNSVHADRLKSVERKAFDAIASHTLTQATLVGDVTDFGFNVEQDLFRAAVGSPKNKKLGSRMTGMDSLLVAVSLKLKALPDLLDKYLVQFNDDAYKISFPWIDNLAEVRDAGERKKLNAKMLDALRSDHPSQRSTWLAVPEVIDWADIGGFRFRESTKAQCFPDLRVSDFLSTVRDAKVLDVDVLKARHIYAYNAADDARIKAWPVFACVYSEVDHGGTTFVLSGGSWYRINRDFVMQVNQDVAKLVSAGWLPSYADKSETAYNQRVAQGSGGKLVLVDRKLVGIGGTQVEFCDLYRRGQMIHVKRYGNSAVLSHLFAQGRISADSFFGDANFRKQVNKILPTGFKVMKPAQAPDPRMYEILYAVISRSPKAIEKSLPFFSRLNLRNAARELHRYGYKVSLTKIQA